MLELMGVEQSLSHQQRVALATLLTMLAVVALEVAHFSRGTSLVLEVGYFAIPAAAALVFFKTLKERAIAFVLLTTAGFLAAAAAIWSYLTH